MRLHETVLRMREWLLGRDVELTPQAPGADELYEGEGQAAHHAWQAFRAVATEPAYDPIKAWGETQPVSNAGFIFEGPSRKAGQRTRTVHGLTPCPNTTS